MKYDTTGFRGTFVCTSLNHYFVALHCITCYTLTKNHYSMILVHFRSVWTPE